MIITPDSDLKDVKQLDIVVNRAIVPDDPPPAYSTPDSQVATSSTPQTILLPPVLPPADVKPSNFLSLSRGNGSVKGSYVIDPRVIVPSLMLPPLTADETEATRRNVFLHTSNGSIDVDLWVLGDADSKVKVNMLIKTSNGSLTAKLHAAPSARPPIHLKAQSSNGSITLHLPRSFRGPVTILSRNGTIRFSSAVGAATTTFSEADHTRRCFVGDFSDWTDDGAWMGDEASIESSNGSVKVQFDAEPRAPDGGNGKGKGTFLGRLLGL
ncbi:hypothetical protein B0H17DRAFT_1052443 [Mycena rosella]|uniref:DUF7330 domain-containing protein n=1 Tax=Mycena rosella TaxID=1033263 RepID=A0AAD7DQD8_MYCRO|nr:hypothetical protein B0H17DRAFT_1052443 [Mycena rosella]